MAQAATIPPPPPGYTLTPPPDTDMEQPIASVRASSAKAGDKVTIGDQDLYVTGNDSKGRPTLDKVPPPPPGYTVNRASPPMSRPEADAFMQKTVSMPWASGNAPGTTSAVTQQPKFGDVALVDPEAPEYGGPIKSSVHADTRGGRNLVPVQSVPPLRQQLQYEAANPDEMARVQGSQQMDTSLPLADRIRARAGLEVRKRTELGLATNDVNDRVQNYAGDKGADFAQFLAESQVRGDGQLSPGATGIVRSIGKNVAQTVTNPITYAAAPLGATGKAGQIALSALFATGAAKSSYDAAGQLGSIWDRPDISSQQKAEMATDLVLNTAMAGLAGAHAVKVSFLKSGDPLIPGIPKQYRDAVIQNVNSVLKKTGGVLSGAAGKAGTAASILGDMAADVANSDRENLPSPEVTEIRRSLPKISLASAKAALPLVRAAADDAGLKTITAGDLLDSQPNKDGHTSLGLIGQAKNKVLAQADATAGTGKTIADLAPEKARPFIQQLDALDELHDHIQEAQEKETAELKAAADKGKIPATKTAALVRMGMGAGKVAVSTTAGPALGRMSRVLLSAYGIPSGFNDLVTGVKGLIASGGKISPTLDENLNTAFSKTRPADSSYTPEGETRPPVIPYQGDLSVQHETNIAPPRHAHGDAMLSPDEEYRPLEPTREQYQPYGGNRSVQHETVIAPPETPHGFARIIPDEPNPRFQMASSSTAEPLPPPIVRAAAATPPRVSTAYAPEITPELEPHQIPLTQSVPARMLSGSVTAARPESMPPISAPRNVAPPDIFPNDKTMEDWLQRRVENNPAIQRARENAQRIRDARETPLDNPGDITVPRGQHPESIVERALTRLSLSDLREAARSGEIPYTAADDNSTLIRKIMDAYVGQDEHLSDLAETLQGHRGEVPAGTREKAPVEDTDLTGILQKTLDAIHGDKASGAMPPLRRPDQRENLDYRAQVDAMPPEQRAKALFFSDKTGLPNYRAFHDNANGLQTTHPIVGYADVDDFKTANTVLGKEAVDTKILPMMGDIFRAAIQDEPGVHVFHRSGDEFLFRADDPAAVTRVVNKVNQELEGAKFTAQRADGTIVEHTGTGLSHGTGANEDAAELAAEQDKKQRKLQGRRTGARDVDAKPDGKLFEELGFGSEAAENNAAQRQGLLSRPDSLVRPVATLRPGDSSLVPTADLNADPARFQYKGGTDEQGVTNALKDQSKYDPNKGGVLLVWKDPADGKTYVVNGHHRFELAQRAGEENVLVRMIDAPDAETAKVLGAETNISEGHGSITDAARFFKGAGIKTMQDAMDRNLPMGQGMVKNGLAMARLDDSIIDQVESGKIPEGRAVAIGTITDSPAQQDAVLQAISKAEARTGRDLNNGEVESIARQVRAAATHIEQGADLFGSFNREQSLFGEQAAIDDYILKQLGADKRTFGAVSTQGRAEALSKVKDQTIKPEENQKLSEQASQAAEMYKKLVNGPGALNDIRTNAAKELASRYSKPSEVKAKAYERVRQELMNRIGESGSTQEGKRQ